MARLGDPDYFDVVRTRPPSPLRFGVRVFEARPFTAQLRHELERLELKLGLRRRIYGDEADRWPCSHTPPDLVAMHQSQEDWVRRELMGCITPGTPSDDEAEAGYSSPQLDPWQSQVGFHEYSLPSPIITPSKSLASADVNSKPASEQANAANIDESANAHKRPICADSEVLIQSPTPTPTPQGVSERRAKTQSDSDVGEKTQMCGK